MFTEQFIDCDQEINKYAEQLRYIYLNCSRAIFVNKSNAEYLLSVLNLQNFEKFNVIYNSIDIEKIRAASVQTSLRQKNLYSKIHQGEKIKVLAASRYVQQKGLDILISSTSILNKHLQNLLCIDIYGEGVEETRLKALAKSQNTKVEIKFHPWTHDLLSLFNIYDLFVYPSRSESLPFTLIEALSNNIPVIASDIEPHLIVTNNGKFSSLFKVGDSNDLARTIENFVQLVSKQNYFNPVKECNQWLVDNFSNDGNHRKVVEIWDSIS